MPNDDKLNAGVQDDRSSCGAQDTLARWMRIPEAWDALRGVPQADVDRIHSPFDLAALFAERQTGPGAPASTWEDAAATDGKAPDDIYDVIRMASALHSGAEAGRTQEIARVVSAKPDMWRSPCG